MYTRETRSRREPALNHRTVRELASRMGRLFSSKERGFFFGFSIFVPDVRAIETREKSTRRYENQTRSHRNRREEDASNRRASQYDSLVVGKTKTSAKRTD